MKLWNIYYTGTSNIAVENICAGNAKTATRIAAAVLGMSSDAYLKAKKVM